MGQSEFFFVGGNINLVADIKIENISQNMKVERPFFESRLLWQPQPWETH